MSTPTPSRPPSSLSNIASVPPSPMMSAAGSTFDMSDLSASIELAPVAEEPLPQITFTHRKLVEEAQKHFDRAGAKKAASVVVIGHVDAGKSTLMGRLLYEAGHMNDKQRIANERASSKIGKSSFSWAWSMDGLQEERERGVTIDIMSTSLSLPSIDLTVLDAPGHRDFVPNLISGATQADTALLVVDARTGEFEAGFEGGGQTREHVLLVRSLGVNSLIVAVNKMDAIDWSQNRFEEIRAIMEPFLEKSGYQRNRMAFVPCAAMVGANLMTLEDGPLKEWYTGRTLADLLNDITPPVRDFSLPLRMPIANVFKGGAGASTGGLSVSGRILTGVVQQGEKVRVLPGDESAVIRRIEVDNNLVPWAAAGSNPTMALSGVEALHVNIGSILCPSNALVPMVSTFEAQIILFDISIPVTLGTTFELFHQSRDIPATIIKLVETLDRTTGQVIKIRPRVLQKNASAHVEIQLRQPNQHGGSGFRVGASIALEIFAANKEMGRVLLRRQGETIGAGIVTRIIS